MSLCNHATCERPAQIRCSGCRSAVYCSDQHQRDAWTAGHRGECSVTPKLASIDARLDEDQQLTLAFKRVPRTLRTVGAVITRLENGTIEPGSVMVELSAAFDSAEVVLNALERTQAKNKPQDIAADPNRPLLPREETYRAELQEARKAYDALVADPKPSDESVALARRLVYSLKRIGTRVHAYLMNPEVWDTFYASGWSDAVRDALNEAFKATARHESTTEFRPRLVPTSMGAAFTGVDLIAAPAASDGWLYVFRSTGAYTVVRGDGTTIENTIEMKPPRFSAVTAGRQGSVWVTLSAFEIRNIRAHANGTQTLASISVDGEEFPDDRTRFVPLGVDGEDRLWGYDAEYNQLSVVLADQVFSRHPTHVVIPNMSLEGYGCTTSLGYVTLGAVIHNKRDELPYYQRNSATQKWDLGRYKRFIETGTTGWDLTVSDSADPDHLTTPEMAAVITFDADKQRVSVRRLDDLELELRRLGVTRGGEIEWGALPVSGHFTTSQIVIVNKTAAQVYTYDLARPGSFRVQTMVHPDGKKPSDLIDFCVHPSGNGLVTQYGTLSNSQLFVHSAEQISLPQ